CRAGERRLPRRRRAAGLAARPYARRRDRACGEGAFGCRGAHRRHVDERVLGMRRPPDRKFMLAATALLVAASFLLARPAVGTDPSRPQALLVKFFGRS